MEKVKPETVIVKDSKFGKGIFTFIDLQQNTTILKITGKPVTFQQTLQMGKDECYCLQISMNKYIIPDIPFRFSNHSCFPNCGINRKMEFVTLKDINAGEELVWDYSTSMLEKHWSMKCNCGYYDCRETINDFDMLPAHIQERYQKMKVVLPFIVEELYGLPTIDTAKSRNLIVAGR